MADNPATRALHALRSHWDAGGDMGNPQGFIVEDGGEHFAVRLELWTVDCLMDCKVQDARAARRRGEALARRWSKEKWPHTGYVDLGGAEGVFGATWAWDKATENELANTDPEDVVSTTARENPTPTGSRSVIKHVDAAGKVRNGRGDESSYIEFVRLTADQANAVLEEFHFIDLDEGDEDFFDKGILYVNNIEIAADRRGAGLGKKLLEAATKGVTDDVWLISSPTGTTDPEGFYQKLGFEAVDRNRYGQVLMVRRQMRQNPQTQPYQGTHLPPGPEDGAPAHDVENMMPDYYEHPEWYFTGGRGPADHEAARILRSVKGRPWAPVWVYRAVPKGIDKLAINPGDWVTTVRAYASEHARSSLGGKATILKAKVRAGELFNEGNSHFEFGWWPASDEQAKAWQAARRQTPGYKASAAKVRQNPDGRRFAYHVTADALLPAIKEEGLRSFEHRHLPEGEKAIFVEDSEDEASVYLARGTTLLRFKVDGFSTTEDGEYVLYDTTVPPGDIEVKTKRGWSPLLAAKVRQNPSKKLPPQAVESDLLDAIQHADLYGDQGWTLDDFDVVYVGPKSLRTIRGYEDWGGWIDVDPADFKGLSVEERLQQLEGFRGKAWAARAAQWHASGKVPPVVAIEAPIESENVPPAWQIGDGRGRINFALAMGRSTLPVIEMRWKGAARQNPHEHAHDEGPACDVTSYDAGDGWVEIGDCLPAPRLRRNPAKKKGPVLEGQLVTAEACFEVAAAAFRQLGLRVGPWAGKEPVEIVGSLYRPTRWVDRYTPPEHVAPATLVLKFTPGGNAHAGLCRWHRTFRTLEIRLNKIAWSGFDDAYRRDTVLHEVAHAVQFMTTNSSDHGPAWKAIALSIGCSGESCVTGDKALAMQTAYNKAKGLPEPRGYTMADVEVGDTIEWVHSRKVLTGRVTRKDVVANKVSFVLPAQPGFPHGGSGRVDPILLTAVQRPRT